MEIVKKKRHVKVPKLPFIEKKSSLEDCLFYIGEWRDNLEESLNTKLAEEGEYPSSKNLERLKVLRSLEAYLTEEKPEVFKAKSKTIIKKDFQGRLF